MQTTWETVYSYFRRQGIPRQVITYFSIQPGQARQIQGLIENTHPRAILEIGTFIGMSTGILALSADCPIVCVDPDLPVEILTSRVGWHEERTAHVFVRGMLAHFGKTEQVNLLVGCFSCITRSYDTLFEEIGGKLDHLKTSEIVGRQAQPYGPYDLIFVDGDHSAQAVHSDLCLAYPMLSDRGVIVLHDVTGAWGEKVLQGIHRFVEEHADFSLKTDHNMGFVSRDCEKAWLPAFSDPFHERIARKLRTTIGTL